MDQINGLEAELAALKRELRIEAALEKVRSKSMAMQKSEDLGELSMELVKQVQTFGLDSWFCAFNIYDEDPRGSIEWGSNGQGTFPQYRTPREGVFLQYFQEGQKGQELVINEIGENECAAHYEYLCSLPVVGETLLQMKDNGIPFPTSQIDHVAFFKYGYVLFITYEPAPEAHDIFKRFAKVFEQTYTRFLDLQKAESQAREAQIEMALEKVRSRTMAMQNSEELEEVILEVLKKLQGLGISMTQRAAAIFTYEDGNKDYKQWVASPEYNSILSFNTPYFDHPVQNDIWNARQNGTDFFAKPYPVEVKNSLFKYLFALPALKNMPKAEKTKALNFEHYAISIAFQKQAALVVVDHSGIPLIEAENSILIRLSKVFNQTYTRFLDLQKAEAQAFRAEQDLIAIKEARKKAEEALSELKQTQKQLIQSEKMASLGELTAGIAHEIQNPLNFVNNFSEVSKELAEELKEELVKGDIEEAKFISEDLVQNLSKINHHGQRASSIVKGMLEHSRSNSGKKELTDLNALADEYLRLAYHGLRAKDNSFNADFKTDFDPNLPKIEVIPQDIGRVLLNLINNAFQAVAEQSKKGIEGYKPLVSVKTELTANSQLLIIIKDNGPGIPDAIKDKIFQPFFTTKPTGKGTGLGLSLAYDIVKAHGGELMVESKEGEGSVFNIQLPIS